MKNYIFHLAALNDWRLLRFYLQDHLNGEPIGFHIPTTVLIRPKTLLLENFYGQDLAVLLRGPNLNSDGGNLRPRLIQIYRQAYDQFLNYFWKYFHIESTENPARYFSKWDNVDLPSFSARVTRGSYVLNVALKPDNVIVTKDVDGKLALVLVDPY